MQNGPESANVSGIDAAVLMERIIQDAYPARRSSEIQPLQWAILRHLVQMPPARCELRWVAQTLKRTRAPVARALATLERRGLLAQTRNPKDTRTKTLSLTERGRDTVRRDPLNEVAGRIDRLPVAEKATFLRVLHSLAQNASMS